MIQIITGKIANERTEIFSAFKYVEDFKESEFSRRFHPKTVGTYFNKRANKKNPIYEKIYDVEGVTPVTKTKKLFVSVIRQLSLYTTLLWTNKIIIDLTGIDPQGGQDIYQFLKTIVASGGAVIMFDSCDEFKNECTTSIQAKYLGEKL